MVDTLPSFPPPSLLLSLVSLVSSLNCYPIFDWLPGLGCGVALKPHDNNWAAYLTYFGGTKDM